MVDFDLILDVAVTCDAVDCATAHGTEREAGCEGQSIAREKGDRGGGGSEEVEGQRRRIRMEEHRRRSREGVAGE